MNTKKMIHENTLTKRTVKVLLFALLLVLGVGQAAGQIPVNIRSASYLGKSLEWSQGDNYSAGYVETANDDDTKQQWIMVNAGNGSFYLKNVAAATAGQNPYLTLYNSNNGKDNWTFSMTDDTGLASDIHYFRARFSLVDNGDGTWAFKTMSFKNANTHFYTYIGIDAPAAGKSTHYTIWGDKLVSNNGRWTIDGLSTISISRSAGSITITATNTTDATVFYTTDGSDPTTSATRQTYSAPFADDGIALVKAIVMKDGRPNSELALSYDYNQKFILQHVANAGNFYMLPGAVNGSDYEVNTYSLMRPSMEWKLEDAGGGDFYIKNDSTDYYLSCNSDGTVRLKATKASTNDFKFMLRLAVDGSYRLEPKAKTTFFLRKSDDNATGAMDSNNSNKIDVKNYWNILPADHIPTRSLPFGLSDDDCAQYVRIHNSNASAYYLIPPTGSNTNASTSDAGESNDRWFIRQVASDDWLTYYAIINASTGQCLQYTGATVGSNNAALTTASVDQTTMASTDNIQFAIASTTNDDFFYLIPKITRYDNNRNYFTLIRRDNTILKLELQRGDNNCKWVFEGSSFTCDAPEFTYDAVQRTINMSSPNNAPIYFVGWNDSDPEPSLDNAADGTLYTGVVNATYTHYKAIAARCTDGTDKSAATIYNLDAPFRCATPVIRYNTNTKTVTMTSATASATIYYTTDGTTPTTASTRYDGPFVYDSTDEIKAIAIRGNETATTSDVTAFNSIPRYIDRSSQITNMAGNYAAGPSFIVDTDTPLGTSDAPFTGTFDGAYVPIMLNHPLFGYADGATIKNVRVSSASISGTDVGAILNIARGTTKVYNCGVLAGSINGSGNVGGLVGLIESGSSVRVVNCYNYATVSGGTSSAGIVGNNQGTVGDVRIAMCMMYGDMPSGTSPVYAGNHVSNNKKYTEYNYWRSRASVTYTAYNDQLAIGKDEWLTRFPFYRHILNTHRELAALFLFAGTTNLTTDTPPTADDIAEIGHWVLDTDVAPYPIIEPWATDTKKTTVDINANLPSTANRYEGKKLDDITADKVYRGDGTQVTTMGTSGMLRVNYSINGTSGYIDLPITDMDTLRYDYTWGKVVLPFANEFSSWTRDYSKICTGWKITGVTGGTAGSLTDYNFADRDCTAKDIYSNSNYIYAQGGNYIVPYGVTAISIEANFAQAYYLSDGYADYGYDANYGSQTNLGWAVPTTYHGQTVYTNLSTLVHDLSASTDPHSQAIVLVGNYHYNQNTIGGVVLDKAKACTIMSIDDDNNQEPDYGWYSFCNTNNGRSGMPHIRFDLLPNIGIGMAARVTNSTPNPTIGIMQCSGSFELTETCVSYMSECEVEGNGGSKLSAADNGRGNNRYIINSGYFIQIVRTQKENVSNLSYMKIGGNAFIEQLYPGSHSDQAQSVNLVPIIVNGGEIEECYMTGYRAGASAIGSDIRFWCAGGKIHKFLGAYMEKPRQTSGSDGTVNLTAKVDHALIKRFFGGGTSASATITGNINITMNNSKVDFFCGGPEFGDMSPGKTVTTTAYGSTFGEYYGAGFGGTATTRVRGENASNNTDGQQEVTFSAATTTYPLAFSNYHYLTNKSGYGVGVGYEFEFIQYAGGTGGKGVARFYTDYASFSLATTGSVTNRLTNCNILKDFYGAGCQGKVNGTVTSTLTGCTVNGSVFGGGYKAVSNELKVMPNTKPTYSVYTKETGVFSDFGTVDAETWEWKQGTAAESVVDAEHKTIYCSNTVNMSELGNVTGAISLTIDGCTVTTRTENGVAAGGNVFGGGNESKSLSNTTVTISDTAGETNVANSVYGGGNKADVMGNATVTIGAGNVLGNVYGGGNEGSVGTFTADANGKPATCGENTGKCTVVIEGNAEIGPDGMQMTRAEGPDDYGHVFGAGKGLMADPADYPEIANIAYVDNTDVTVRGNAFVKGSVYGGSESGHVLHNTDVKIEGGQIGCGKETIEPFGDDVWSDTYVPTDNNNLDCPSWTFEKPYAPYDPYANATGNLDQYENGKSTDGGRRVASDGHTYYGNVFGGGSGSIPYFDETKGTSEYLMTAGTVEGNTSVTISGGHVLTNVYGGCETTNVLGSVTIAMTGGTVGVPRTVAQIVAHPLTGYIFGAGKGDQRVFFNKETNVDRVTVSVEGGRVYSSVYGGGEDGHVLQNTTVNIGKAGEAGPTIGTWGTSYVDGNVFGGGRGFGGEALTAGNVGGSVELNIISGKILGSVYGGGRMASVGYGLYLEDEEITEDEKKIKPYGILRPDDKYDGSYPNPSTEDAADYYDKGRGYITINITGGTIGNNSEYIYNPTAEQKAAIPKTTFDYQNHLQYTKGGNVFTGGMGRLYALDNTTLLPLWSKLGKCKQTTLNMTGGTVKSSIYGGGELGAVAENATVNINGGTVGTKVVDKEDETKYYYFGSVFGGGKGSVDNITYPSATPEEEQIPISEAGTTGGDVLVKLNEGPASSDDAKGAIVHQVFGCNDMNGSPKGDVTVHVYATQNADKVNISTKYDRETNNYDVETVYGGGNLAAYEPEGGTNTTRSTKVIIDGCGLTSIKQVYGGGNAASTPATNVEVNGTYEIMELFGGGNGLDNLPDGRPNPGANVGYKNYTVYEKVGNEWVARDSVDYDTKEERTAGNSAITYGTGKASINVFGGTIHRVFGGSNTKGNVRQAAVTLLDEGGECEFCVDEAYGGGKSAEMDAEAQLLMACIPGLEAAYGGAEAADVRGNVTLNITNGTFDRVFGGNNLSGTINGSITVNIEEIGCRPIKIGELYGGGNQAGYSVYGYNANGTPKESGTKIYEDPQVNVKSFTSIGKVFGGGYGNGATMVGNPTVNVNEVYGKYYNDNASVVAEGAKTPGNYPIPSHAKGKMGAISEIFGGGNAAKVIGSTNVNIGTLSEVYIVKTVTTGAALPTGCYTRSGAGTTSDPFVYTAASGNAVDGTTYYEKQDVQGADIRGNVYGGGNNAEVTGDANVQIGKKAE